MGRGDSVLNCMQVIVAILSTSGVASTPNNKSCPFVEKDIGGGELSSVDVASSSGLIRRETLCLVCGGE